MRVPLKLGKLIARRAARLVVKLVPLMITSGAPISMFTFSETGILGLALIGKRNKTNKTLYS